MTEPGPAHDGPGHNALVFERTHFPCTRNGLPGQSIGPGQESKAGKIAALLTMRAVVNYNKLL